MSQNRYNLRRRGNPTVTSEQEQDQDDNDVYFSASGGDSEYSDDDTLDSSLECLENIVRNRRQTNNCHVGDAVSRRLPPPSATSSRMYPTRIICNSNRIRGIASDVDETTTTPVMNSVRSTGNDTTPSNNVQVVASIQTRRRIPWTRDDYKELMWCYYQAEIQDVKSEKNIFNIWRSRNPHIRPNMTPSTLSSQRRFVVKNTKLTNDELATIKANVSRELGIIPEDVTADLLSFEMPVNNDEIMELCLVESHNEHCSRGLPLTIYDEINTKPVDQAQVSSESTQNITNVLDQGSQYVNLTEDQLLLEVEIMNELSISLTRKFDERVRLPKVFESHKLNKYIADSNVIIEKYKHSHPYLDLTKINHLIFAVATVVTRKFKNIHTERSIRPPNQTIPKWQKRIERKINEWRKEISILSESKFPRASDKVKHKTRQIKRKYRTHDCIQLDEILKQKISAYAQRISRYKKRNNGYKQNKMFNQDKKRFYRMLMEKNINIQNAPNPQDVQDFWSELWGTPYSINQDAMWIKREEERMENTETMSEFIINHVDLVEAIQNTQNWKAPGWDSIQNFWIKKLHAYFRPAYRYVESDSDETMDSSSRVNRSAELEFLPGEDDDEDDNNHIDISIPHDFASEASGTCRTTRSNQSTRSRTSQLNRLSDTATGRSTISNTSRSSGRMRWTRDMNLHLISAYYIATKLETVKTKYMSDVTKLWNDKYPTIQMTNSRLNSQLNSLFRRNVFSRIELSHLKESASRLISAQDSENNASDEDVDDPEVLELEHQVEQTIQPNVVPPDTRQPRESRDDIETHINEHFQHLKLKYKSMSPQSKPVLPKVPNSKKSQMITEKGV
ncbi:hypothetical protein M8J75_015605 [Diaphorina citri]|nr:hypothetical protein M8J75_015605 [Diaphorina citri]